MLHPELRLELQGDPVLAPLRMIGRDATNQADVAPRASGSAAQPTVSSSPVAPIARPVPPEDRRWLDQRQRVAPPIPVPAEPDPEHTVCRSQQRPGPSSLKHGELMTEDGVLSRQKDAGSSRAIEGVDDENEP